MEAGRLCAVPSTCNVDLLQALEFAGLVAHAQEAKVRRWQLATRAIFSLLVMSVVLSFSACEETKSQAAAPVAPAAATSAPPSPSVYLASGLIVVENQLDLAALRDGVISAIAADTGKFVHKGDLLASIDDRQLSSQHDSAEAKV